MVDTADNSCEEGFLMNENTSFFGLLPSISMFQGDQGAIYSLAARSEGCDDKYKSRNCGVASIVLNGIELAPQRRGHNIVAINPDNGDTLIDSFDTHSDIQAVKNLISFIDEIPKGWLVAMAVQDEGCKALLQLYETELSYTTVADKYCEVALDEKECKQIADSKSTSFALWDETSDWPSGCIEYDSGDGAYLDFAFNPKKNRIRSISKHSERK
jgi:hypothetical protein